MPPSWSFKHLVNVEREKGCNAVNLLSGYRPIHIVNPLELILWTPRPKPLMPSPSRASGGNAIAARLAGSLLVSEGLRFEASDNTIRLVDVRVERFVIDGLPASWQRQLDRLGKPLARGLLEDQVLYTLRPKDVAALEGRGLRPGDLRVTSSGIEITLLPALR